MPRITTAPLVLAAAAFTLANGYIHAREWFDVYRDVPTQVPGAEVVRIGFPVNAALSVLAALALVGAFVWARRYLRLVAVGVGLFQLGSLAALIVSRTGSLLGWQEPVWNRAAEQTRAVEIGALVCLGAVVALDALRRRRVRAERSPADETPRVVWRRARPVV